MHGNLTIFTVFHRPFIFPEATYVCPIQAGLSNTAERSGKYTDSDGVNIGHLNNTYAELTAVYSIWKNSYYNDCLYWGLAHYRRYFCLELHWTKIKKKNIYYLPASEKSLSKIFSPSLEKYFSKVLSPQTVILPKKQLFKTKKKSMWYTVKAFYESSHKARDWMLLEETIKKICPLYLPAFKAVENEKRMLFFNMMIAHKEVWNLYNSWLFVILFEMAKYKKEYDTGYQERVYGFLGERLQQIYFHHHADAYNFIYMPVAVLN